jgi:hypothetical protein
VLVAERAAPRPDVVGLALGRPVRVRLLRHAERNRLRPREVRVAEQQVKPRAAAVKAAARVGRPAQAPWTVDRRCLPSR